LKDGWPEYLDQLEQMFEGVAVDGSTAYVPGSNKEVDGSTVNVTPDRK